MRYFLKPNAIVRLEGRNISVSLIIITKVIFFPGQLTKIINESQPIKKLSENAIGLRILHCW